MSSRYLQLNVRDAVKVGGATLPGIITGLSVQGSLEITQDKIQGASDHITSIGGYTTATVNLDITLHGDAEDRERQLLEINKIFMFQEPAKKPDIAPDTKLPVQGQTPNGIQPTQLGTLPDSVSYYSRAWRVVNPHLNARRIRLMLFTEFSSREGNDEETTVVSLTFKEILSEQARIEKASQQDGSGATNPQTGTVELPGIVANQPKAGEGTDPKAPPAFLRGYLSGLKDPAEIVLPPSMGGSINLASAENRPVLEAGAVIVKALQHSPNGLSFEDIQNSYPKNVKITVKEMLSVLEEGGMITHTGTGSSAVYKAKPKH